MSQFRLPARATLLLCAFLVLTSLVYLPGLYGDFVYDDWGSITGNPNIQVKDGIPSEWFRAALLFPSGTPPFRSLGMATFAANYFVGGLDPFGFKLANLSIHMLNGVLLFLALRALFDLRSACATLEHSWYPIDGGLAAAAVAGLWLLLPINLTAVLYVVQRLESFAASFVFLGLWWYLRARLRVWQGSGGAVELWLSVGLCTSIGLLVKETAVMLPLYAAMAEFCISRGRNRDRARSRAVFAMYSAFLALPLIVGLSWILHRNLSWGLLGGNNTYLIDRLLTESRIMFDYVAWTLLPSLDLLTLYHDDIALSHSLFDPITTAASLAAIIALITAALWQRRQRPLFTLGVLWFFAGHILTGTVVPLILAFEHRNYFSSAGLLLACASLVTLEGPLKRVTPRYALVVALALFYAGTTWMRAREWADPLRLAASDAMKRPTSSAAQFDYAQALLIESMKSHSGEPAQTALSVLDKARNLPDAGIHFEQSMITLLGESGYSAPESIWSSLIEKLRKGPPDTNGIHALTRLNHCFSAKQCKESDLPQLRSAYATALSHMPVSGGLLAVHAEFAWHVEGDHSLAERNFREALTRSPNDISAQMNLIVVLIYEGKKREAEAMIETMERRNHFGMLDSFIKPLRATLNSVANDTASPPAAN